MEESDIHSGMIPQEGNRMNARTYVTVIIMRYNARIKLSQTLWNVLILDLVAYYA